MRALVALLLIALPTFLLAKEDGAAEPVLEVIELQHRLASGVIAVVAPLLGNGETIGGANEQIFLRVFPQNRDQVIHVIRRLDTVARNLLVSVRQGESQQVNQRDAKISGRFPAGDGAVQIGNDRHPASVKLGDHVERSSNTSTQQLRVLEGGSATIFVGQQVPVASPVITRNGQVLSYTSRELVSTGFSVVPRLVGDDRVVLQISPQQQSLNSDGSINTSGATTQASGRLGEWIEIGSAVNAASGQNSGLLSRSSSSQARQNSVAVKVETVGP